MGVRPRCSRALPQDRKPPDGDRGQGGFRAWGGGHWEFKEPGAQRPLWGDLRLRNSRCVKGTGLWVAKPDAPPSCSGFRTLKTHPLLTLDCAPGRVVPTVSATQAECMKPAAEHAPAHVRQQGAQLPGFSGQGMESPYLPPLSRSFPGRSTAAAAPDLRLDHVACRQLSSGSPEVPPRWAQGGPCSLAW